VAIGFAQFMVVWGGWLAYGVTFLAACSGLTRAMLQGLLKVSSWSEWEPWAPFSPADISDATVATVLGLMGLLLWIAAIGHFLVMLARAASLLVLMATTPIAAAGLVSDAGKAWFWKSLRWFHAAALSPVVMVMVLGVGVQFTTGVANGLTGVQGAIGTAVPGVILICISTVSPLALFKLLSFVDPATTSGASLRAGMAAVGGVQGLLTGNSGGGGGSNQAAATDDQGRSAGEDGAADATSSRFNSAVQGGMSQLGAAGQVAARGVGLIASIGAAGAAMGADVTNQMGVGHSTYPPDFSMAGRRATAMNQNQPGQHQAGPESSGDTPTESTLGGYPDRGGMPALPSSADAFTTSAPPPGAVGAAGGHPGLPAGGSGAASVSQISAADAAVLV